MKQYEVEVMTVVIVDAKSEREAENAAINEVNERDKSDPDMFIFGVREVKQ